MSLKTCAKRRDGGSDGPRVCWGLETEPQTTESPTAGDPGLELDSVGRDGEKPSDPPAQAPPGLQSWWKLGPREGKGGPAITEQGPALGSQPLLQGHLTLGLPCLSRQS